MNLPIRLLLGVALSLGLASAAHAAPYTCTYRVTDGPVQGNGVLPSVEAGSESDALNQAMAWIYTTHGPVGFSVQCRPA